jgi:hypothetical protein
MIERLRRLLSRALAARTRHRSASHPPRSDDNRDAGPRIEAARQRLKQTIPPPEDPAP